MKTSMGSLSLLALIQLVTAQKACLGLTTLFPSCAFPCVTSAGSAVGCTVATDLACRCDPVSSRSIQNLAVGCVIAACTKAGEIGSALAAGPSICKCVATAVPDTTTTSEEPPAETTTDVTTTTTAPETTTEATSTSEDTTGPITSTTSAGDTTETETTETEPPQDTTTESETEPPQDTTTESETEPPQDTTTESETETETETTKTAEPTCSAGTTEDCGPVATTAIPECAQACFTSAAPDIGCGVHDYACQCEEEAQASLSQILVPCVLTACDAGDLPAIITGASSVCACATAAPPPGDCTTTDDGTATETGTKPPTHTDPPATETGDTTTACPDATTQDCGPVATSAVPECAHACFSSAAPNVGCEVDDYACQCEDAALASMSQLLIPCVATACDSGDLPAVITGASSVCACAHADPTGGCGTENPPSGSDTTTAGPTKTGGGGSGGDTTTCADATTSDCGPVATSAVPECAHACFSSAAPNVGCEVDDYACQCEDAALASMSQLLIPCVATACDSGDLPAVITGASSVCACAHAGPTGGCAMGNPPDGGDTTEVEPTKTGGSGGGQSTTCADATTSDCGPVASSVIPACAQACFTSAAPNVGCDVDDYACQCEDEAQASLSQLLIPCVATACDSGDLPGVITGASSVCACATAPPSGGDCGGSGGGGGEPTKTGGSGSEPTGGDGSGSTCVSGPVTSADCAPVASSAVPSCAHACFSSAAPGVGCGVNDYACQCEAEAQASLSQLLVPCVATACDSDQLAAVITGASAVCACATAPPSGGDDCGGSEPTETGGSGSEPTGGSGGDGEGSTCVAGTITAADCGPVASSAVPSCAHACFSSAAPGVGCGAEDYACQCEAEAQASLSQLLVPCVATACDSDQLASVIAGASSVCACATAAPAGGDDCGGSEPTETGGSGSEPTGGSGGDGEGSTCVAGPLTSADCAPVASSAVPSCAHACFSSAAPGVGCDAEDYACQCEAEAQASLSELLVPCVATACDSDQLVSVIAGASAVCACALAEPTGGSDCESGSGGSGGSGGEGGNGGGGATTCVTVTKAGSDGEVIKSTSCYPASGGQTLTTKPASPTAQGDGSSSGSDSDSPSETEPAVVVGSAARFEIGLVTGVFGAFWLVAVAL
ncbi:hypothetical protein G7Z17_g5224 [Cylindrodendrum hubeiense]|uniref:CFEM domain-containing protein n=1 Tax=Cylindrodendrum hubeiense TaxID=595255 RepID=A0A9P5LI31_9HYPO|nr:hypothetical protein G7Z17_g5224 [Cylindrodendrum hubeiense]